MFGLFQRNFGKLQCKKFCNYFRNIFGKTSKIFNFETINQKHFQKQYSQMFKSNNNNNNNNNNLNNFGYGDITTKI